MWVSVLWTGMRVAMWITHADGKFRHGLLEKSLIIIFKLFRGLQLQLSVVFLVN